MRLGARFAAAVATAVALTCLPASAQAAMTRNELSTYCAAALSTNSSISTLLNFGVCASFVEPDRECLGILQHLWLARPASPQAGRRGAKR